jgi:2-polyprenyl-3-methyl-5-hydroxy-6-metoxy-1,4-benzoquinol methylase
MAIQHYQGTQGREYFRKYWPPGVEVGMQYQARYFLPYTTAADVVLDFGCGDGGILRNVAARRRIGIEVNETARAECQRLGEQSGVAIDLHESLDCVAPGSVDVVISNHCLEHVSHPMSALEQLFAVLRPSGTIVLVTPFDDWRNNNNRNWLANNVNHHLYTWSPMNIGNLLTDAGFEVDSIRIYTRSWTPKLFWIWRVLGPGAFDVSCRLLGFLKVRREVCSTARKL